MKFQHTTSLAIQPGIIRRSLQLSSGASGIMIPGQDSLFTVTVQEIVLSWTNVTAAGQINISGVFGDSNPFVVYQGTGEDNIVVPFCDEVYQLGTYGLRVSNNATGGSYAVSVFYTQILP